MVPRNPAGSESRTGMNKLATRNAWAWALSNGRCPQKLVAHQIETGCSGKAGIAAAEHLRYTRRLNSTGDKLVAPLSYSFSQVGSARTIVSQLVGSFDSSKSSMPEADMTATTSW